MIQCDTNFLKRCIATALVATAVAAAALDELRAPLKLRDVSATNWEEPFRGVTAERGVMPGLFTRAQTGVSTEPLPKAADRAWSFEHPHAQP